MVKLSMAERREFSALVFAICACGMLLLVGFAVLCAGCREVRGWCEAEAVAGCDCLYGAAVAADSVPGDYPEAWVEE